MNRLFGLFVLTVAVTASPFHAVAKSAAAAQKPEILIDDDFNDNDLKANPAGKGAAWFTRGEKTAIATEENGMASVILSSEESNRALYSNDRFDFWNDSGVTITWKVGPAKIQTPSPWRAYNTIVWDLAVISGHADKKVSPYLPMQNFGGFYVRLGQQKNVPEAQLSVNVTNKNLGFHGNDILPNTPGYAQPTAVVLNVKYPLVITARLNKTGWSVLVKQDIEDIRLAGNWTTDIPTASIADEFADGAFLLMHCRNNGLDGKHYGVPYPSNTFSIDRVTLEAGGGVPTPGSPRSARSTAGRSRGPGRTSARP